MTWERSTHVEPARVRNATTDPAEMAAWGAGELTSDALRWDVEATDHGSLFRLTHDAIGDDANGERVFVTLYGVTLLTIRLLGFALDAYARRERLYSHEQADEELQTNRRTLVPVVISYVVAILVGLALPTLAVVLYFALAVFLVVPFSEVRRLMFKRS